MKRVICMFIVSLALVGCQSKEQVATPSSQMPTERQEIAHKLITQSLENLQNKDLKAAIQNLEAAMSANPQEPEAFLLMGQILLNVNQYDKAAEFLDGASKKLPDNGTIFYMMSIANKMAGKKLPAVLAARRSAEIFQAAKDKDNFLKSAVMLQDLINMPDEGVVPASINGAAKPAQSK